MSEEPSLPVEIYAKQGDHPDIRWMANEVLRLRAENAELEADDAPRFREQAENLAQKLTAARQRIAELEVENAELKATGPIIISEHKWTPEEVAEFKKIKPGRVIRGLDLDPKDAVLGANLRKLVAGFKCEGFAMHQFSASPDRFEIWSNGKLLGGEGAIDEAIAKAAEVSDE